MAIECIHLDDQGSTPVTTMTTEKNKISRTPSRTVSELAIQIQARELVKAQRGCTSETTPITRRKVNIGAEGLRSERTRRPEPPREVFTTNQ
jgi:hypothetical protein